MAYGLEAGNDNFRSKKGEPTTGSLRSIAQEIFARDTDLFRSAKNISNLASQADFAGLSLSPICFGDATAAQILAQNTRSIKGNQFTPERLQNNREQHRTTSDIPEKTGNSNNLIVERTVQGRVVRTVDTSKARALGFVVSETGLGSSAFAQVNEQPSSRSQRDHETSRFRDTSRVRAIDFAHETDIYNTHKHADQRSSGKESIDRGKKSWSDNDEREKLNDGSSKLNRCRELRELVKELIDWSLNRRNSDGRCLPPGNYRPCPPRDFRPNPSPKPPRDLPPAPRPSPPDVPPNPSPPRDLPPAPQPVPPRDVPPPTPAPPKDNPTPPAPPEEFSPEPKDDPAPDLKVASEKFDKALEKLSSVDKAELKRSKEQMIQSCRSRGLSDLEIAKTLDQTSRLIETRSGALDAASEEQARLIAVAGILKNSTQPDHYINQGAHNSCNVTTVEERTYNNNPSRAAKIIADSILTGQFTSLDGRQVTLHKDAIRPDSEARSSQLQGENLRSYASQIFQSAVLTDLGSRNNPPVMYIANGGPGASGEGWINPQTGQKFSFNGTTLEEIVRMNHFVNGDSGVVAAGFSSPHELESWIRSNLSKKPLIIGVDGNDPLFYGDHSRSDGSPGGINHVVSVREYDAVNRRVRVSNQWGSDMDFWVSLDLLYQAT